jgi:hypothetical protein
VKYQNIAVFLSACWLAACTTAEATGRPFTVADAFATPGKSLATLELSPTPTLAATLPPNSVAIGAPTLDLPTSVALGIPTLPIGAPTTLAVSETPSSELVNCASQPPLPFAAVWVNVPQARELMRCPAGSLELVTGVWQFFERGAMFWRQSDSSIFAISDAAISDTKPTDSWWRIPDTWTSAEGDDLSPGLDPPPGFIKPLRGFGKIWAANGFVRQALGWATSEEINTDSQWLTFEGGWMMAGPNSSPIYVMVSLDMTTNANGYHLGPQ